MKITIEVPKDFEIELSQIRNYVVDHKWKHYPFREGAEKFQSPKYECAFAIIPTTDKIYDIEYCIFSLVRFLANVEDVGIEEMITLITKEQTYE